MNLYVIGLSLQNGVLLPKVGSIFDSPHPLTYTHTHKYIDIHAAAAAATLAFDSSAPMRFKYAFFSGLFFQAVGIVFPVIG